MIVTALKVLALIALWIVLLLAIALINIAGKCSREEEKTADEMGGWSDMDVKKSKFDYASFNGGYDDFAVNKAKYSIEEALDLYRQEWSLEDGMKVSVTTAFVRHRAGINEDGEPCVGWWLEYEENKRSCPVFAMHRTFEDETRFSYKYDIYVLGGG